MPLSIKIPRVTSVILTSLLLSLSINTAQVYASEPSNWAVDEINSLNIIGAITPALTTDYQAPLTRAAFVELIINTFEDVVGSELQLDEASNPFQDTSATYVLKAYQHDIVKGVTEDTFDSSAVMTREQMTVMYTRLILALENHYQASILTASDSPTSFIDQSEISPWAVEDIESAINIGLISGDLNNRINPQSISTNEEALMMNYRLLSYLEDKGFLDDSEYLNIDASAEVVEEDVAAVATTETNVTMPTPDTIELVKEPIETPPTEVEAAEPVKAIVVADVLNMRSAPDLNDSSNIIYKLKAYEEVYILKEEGDWCYVATNNDLNGFVHHDYIHEYKADEDLSDVSMEIIAFAKQYIGTPYRYAGKSLTSGIDCSGFTSQVFKPYGYSLSSSSSGQGSDGVPISEQDLLPGDLVVYGYSGSISHVALYIGQGQIIHATTSNGVKITDMRGYLRKPIIGFRRVLL